MSLCIQGLHEHSPHHSQSARCRPAPAPQRPTAVQQHADRPGIHGFSLKIPENGGKTPWKWWKKMENSSHTFPTNVQFTPLGRVVFYLGEFSWWLHWQRVNETKHLVDRSTVVQKQHIDLAKPGSAQRKRSPTQKNQKTKPPTTQQP